jgi:hypothetical protein
MFKPCGINLIALSLAWLFTAGCRAGAGPSLAIDHEPPRPRAPANWSIGIVHGAELSLLSERRGCPNPRLTKNDLSPKSTSTETRQQHRGTQGFVLKAHQITPLKVSTAIKDPLETRSIDFVADPFLVREGQKWYLFFELFNKDAAKGEIGVAESFDLCEWRYRGVALSESFHLSYPNVFKSGDQYFMLPESKQAGEIRLYRAEAFPTRWKLDTVLVRGEYTDPTPLRYRGRWWIFANRSPYALFIFSAPSLRGRYVSHPANPIFDGDPSRARPAGPIVISQGEPLRFVQDNRQGYGKRVRMVRIKKLSLDEYEERLEQPDPLLKEAEQGWNSFGMHHLSAIQRHDGSWVAAVDGNAR